MDVTAMLNTFTEGDGKSKLEVTIGNDSLVDNHIDRRRHKHSTLSSFASFNPISHSRFLTVSSLQLPKERSTECVDGGGEGRLLTRPASPSDAILIKRTTTPVIPYLSSVVESEYSQPNLQ
jgi:hypothetical protein